LVVVLDCLVITFGKRGFLEADGGLVVGAASAAGRCWLQFPADQ
jgi:hypothetical protein